MKAIRFVMMAVMTVFIGTSFVSCLDDGDSRDYGLGWVTLDSSGEFLYSITSDNGYTFNATNSSVLKSTIDGTVFYPTRAFISFYYAEGTVFEEGRTEYTIEIYDIDYFSMATASVSMNPVEGKTDVETLMINYGNHYIDVIFATQADNDNINFENYNLYVEKAEDKTIFLNMINVEEEFPSTANQYIIMKSFTLPYRIELTSKYEDLEFVGSNNDSIYVKIINTVNGSDLNKFKVKIR